MSKTKVYIVDDHQIVIDGLETYFFGNEEFELVGFANSSKKLFEDLGELKIDVLILDINLPNLSGIQIARIVKQKYNSIKTVFLSANIDENSLSDSIEAGGMGYFTKDIDEEDFFIGLNKIKKNESYYSKGIHNTLFGAYSNKTNKNEFVSDVLSQREVEVIKLFADGLSFKEIADELCISTRTVESHKKNILVKLDLKNTIELVKYAILNGISDL
ncbi:MAG: hypothetical protein DRI86_06520 [Bacteroidetes bacterium]|nr:MAG: hypothetical protein DRI86_06520 [Bacteroidota bacterium]